jgi:hypothetical protein
MAYRKCGFLYPKYQYPELWEKQFFSMPVVASLKRCNPDAIVLDIDETLVLTTDRINPPRGLHSCYQDRNYVVKPDGRRNWGVTRPHCQEFLQYCRNNFKYVFIWTAGHELYANAMVDHLFPTDEVQPDAVYNRNHCDLNRIASDESSMQVNRTDIDAITYHKPLKRICEDWGLKKENVIIVDNNPNAIMKEDMENLINIPDYQPVFSEEDDDNYLLHLIKWLETKPFVNGDVNSCSLKTVFST